MADKERREQIAKTMGSFGPKGMIHAQRLRDNKCPLCGSNVNESEFRDQLSRDEFELSHICQSCQDFTFSDKL